MSSKNKIPAIRFRGFSGEWKETTLGLCAEIIGGGTPSTDNADYWGGDIDWYSPAEIGNNVYANGSLRSITIEGLNNSSAKILPVGTVLFSSRAGIGSTAILAKEGATNQGFQSIVPIDGKLDTYFIYSRTNELKAYGEANGAGSTFVEISGKQMAKMSLLNPLIDEQQQIGKYFKNIDHLITQSTKRLEKLKNLKKAYLEKMFPRGGATTPELRFKGFSEEWKKKFLCEITQYNNGKGYECEQSNCGIYELINLNSISIDGGLKCSGKFIQKAEDTLLKGDLVMVLSDVAHGDLLGRVAVIPENNRFVLNQRVAMLRPIIDLNSYFLFSYINSNQNYFKLKGAGSSQLNLSKESVEKFTVMIPNMNEQNLICNFFRNIDEQIAKQTEKLDKLKNIKKACLDKMFV